MKTTNLEKLIKFVSATHTDLLLVKGMDLENEDLDEMILRLGRKLSFLKAIRGPVEPESSRSPKLDPKWNTGADKPQQKW
jgi:hypothetical protein